jgi:outer membrane biosynthesis protein TonB
MFNVSRHAPFAALAAAAMFSLTWPAFAQAPSDAQRAAIRSACRSDYIAHCSSVPPGGPESLQCLQKHMSSLAPGCQSAVRAVEPAEAPKTETPKTETPKAEAKPEAKPETKTEAKPETPAAATAPAEKPAAETAPAPEPKSVAAPAAAPGMARKPTSAQTSAVRSACRSDFIANCSSVQPGGPAALKCLMQNEAKLSARCRQAVAAIGGSAAPAGAPADAAAAPGEAPAVAPLVLRPMMPREVLFVMRAGCGMDARALCAGVPPGGGRLLECLASQPASLSAECTRALSPFAR